jgi:hypothetical protein
MEIDDSRSPTVIEFRGSPSSFGKVTDVRVLSPYPSCLKSEPCCSVIDRSSSSCASGVDVHPELEAGFGFASNTIESVLKRLAGTLA